MFNERTLSETVQWKNTYKFDKWCTDYLICHDYIIDTMKCLFLTKLSTNVVILFNEHLQKDDRPVLHENTNAIGSSPLCLWKARFCLGTGTKIVFDEDFLMHSLRKSLSDTYMILLCNYYFFWHKMGGIKKFELFRFSSDFKAVVCKVFICMSYWWNRFFFLLLYFKRGLKWAQIPKFAYLKGT